MELLLLFVNLAGGVTLLLWAVRMVRTGFERANGNALRAAIRRSGNGRTKAAAIGLSVAVLLQSSTAVAVLAAGFAASEVISVGQGLALLLGADLGSAVVAQLLSFDVQWLSPLFLLVGGAVFLKGPTSFVRQVGRIVLGIGLILLSLRLIGEATAPLRTSWFLADTMKHLENDAITSFVLGALVAWLVHSSVASVLLIATLVAQSVIPWSVGVAFILGTNLGSGLIAYALTRNHTPLGRRIPVGNLIFRSTAAVIVLITLQSVPLIQPSSPGVAGVWIVYAHVLFNASMLILCLPFVGVMETLTRKLMPSPVSDSQHLLPLHDRKTALDPDVLTSPLLALASVTRECLRVADIIEIMFQPVMHFYERADKVAMQEVLDLEQIVNKTHSNIKLYVSEIDDTTLSERDNARKLELVNFAINMESVGDIISKNLLTLAKTKKREHLTFSEQGWSELTELHKQVISNMHLALNTLVSRDDESARTLIEEKDRIREQERSSNEKHLRRMQTGALESIETSDLHLETLRALRQINSLFATVAYPILSKSGDLLNSRLAQSR